MHNRQLGFSAAGQPGVVITPSAERGPTADDDAIEVALIVGIRAGNQQAFEALYHRYYQRIARFIYRTMGHTDALEELINDTMYVVWRKADTFSGSAKPSTWIFGIAYNKALKSLKNRYRQQPEYDSDITATLEHQYPDDKPNAAEQLENAEWVACAFAQLPPEQRATVELTYYNELSYQEIAELMQCSENTVKTRMFHARKKLQIILPRLASASVQAGRAQGGESP